MAYRHADFLDGAVPMRCSICGRRRKFPDEIEQSDDKLFRCLDACSERTALSVDQERAAFRPPPEMNPPALGLGKITPTFLQESQALQAIRIPGWTPTTTFYDDFTILPGDVGSSWTTGLTGTASVSATGGVARLTPGTGHAWIWAPSVVIPDPTGGQFYCRVLFSSPDTATPMDSSPTQDLNIGAQHLIVGAPGGANIFVGARNSISPTRYYLRGASFLSSVYASADQHFVEMWWNGDGSIWASIDSEPPFMSTRGDAQGYVPFVGNIVNAGYRLDLYDAVFMV